ncbi:MAG: hypothetical protein K2O13_05810, partial [Lachnospiraceae bacterium]|nr:hypothetical protein [Lachnospiraceae bacterium]
MAQHKFSYARRRNEAYWGTPIDNNAVYGNSGKSDAQVIFEQFLIIGGNILSGSGGRKMLNRNGMLVILGVCAVVLIIGAMGRKVEW